MDKTLSFRISSRLKNIIGRELISDKYIAIFELVKNSYDAGAELVSISYSVDKNNSPFITISDDGVGMNYDDIVNKWLFVAYSEKKTKNRPSSYIDYFKRGYAGAKGIGRFSCDRLGSKVKLYSKKENENKVHVVEIDWDKFEEDDETDFINVPVDYSSDDHLPSGNKYGTSLLITDLREDWERGDLLYLKRSLMKLITPDFDKGVKPFRIEIMAPNEISKDKEVEKNPNVNIWRDTVNGFIHNDILEKLDLKTTNIDVFISEDGKTISTILMDRGIYVFTLKERNRDYLSLKNIHFSLYYLNRAAKTAFTSQMGGVRPVNYGSVFVYKNGFRVNPYGEPGEDFWEIDKRKAQGWMRYLGTREIMGRISIFGDNDDFTETSSRAHGFVQTPAVRQLQTFFTKKVLMILEKYVVNLIAWGEPLKNRGGHVITPNELTDEIIAQFITNINLTDVISFDYNKDVFFKNNDAKTDVHTNIKRLENYAEKSGDEGFRLLANTVRKNAEALMQENIELENENRNKTKEVEKLSQENSIREKQIFFLNNIKNQDVDSLLNGLHTIYTFADANIGNLDYCIKLLREKNSSDEILDVFSDVYQADLRIRKIADLAFHGNSSLKEELKGSIIDFIQQYVDTQKDILISVNIKTEKHISDCIFNPSAIGIIIDNVISNSQKNEATNLDICFSQENDNTKISFIDNGLGITNGIDTEKLFEKGFSMNPKQKGFGFGLAYIRDLVTEMKGSVVIDEKYKNGFKLDVRLRNE